MNGYILDFLQWCDSEAEILGAYYEGFKFDRVKHKSERKIVAEFLVKERRMLKEFNERERLRGLEELLELPF